MLALYVIISGFFLAAIDGAGNFDYDRPGDWVKIQGSSACGTKSESERQSPIDIPPQETTYERRPPLVFDGLNSDQPFHIDFTPDGAGFAVPADVRDKFIWKKSLMNGLPSDMKLLQFHFHSPSEHSIDGNLSPLEVHLVHTSVDVMEVADEIGEVLSHPNGLAVYGIMFEFGPAEVNNTFMDDFIAMLLNVTDQAENPDELEFVDEGALHKVKQIHDLTLPHMSGLIPEDGTTDFYTYPGSLTTPPCYESVQWFVAKTKPLISISQFLEINRLHATSINNRPVQPLNPKVRKITRTFEELVDDDGVPMSSNAKMVATSIWIYLFLAISRVLA